MDGWAGWIGVDYKEFRGVYLGLNIFLPGDLENQKLSREQDSGDWMDERDGLEWILEDFGVLGNVFWIIDFFYLQAGRTKIQ